MRVIALSALALPLGFIAQVAYQDHPWQKPQAVVSVLAGFRTK